MRSRSVGIVGLGIMGSAMAGNLLKGKFRVEGYDVARPRRAALGRVGGVPVESVEDLRSTVIVTSLPSAEALGEVAERLQHRCIVVETSTLPLEDKLAARDALRQRGITLLDCPLSGTGAQAKTGDLVVLGSGDEAAYRKVKPVLKGFARSEYYLGEFGHGSRMKFVANLLVAIHNVSAAEALVLGMKAGLDPATVLKVAADGAGGSRMLQVRGPQMVKGRYDEATMKVEVWQKDMKIIAEFAARLGAATPLFNASAVLYNAAMAQGFAKEDTASVCAVIESMSGVARAPRRRDRRPRRRG